MAWIRTIAPEDATGSLKLEYDTAIQQAGRVWNIVRVVSLNALTLVASRRFYRAIMYGASALSRAQREMLGVVVSRANHCRY